MFFIHIFFWTSFLTLPWAIAGFLHPFYTFSPAHSRVICETFIFDHSVNLLAVSVMVLSGHFLPTGVFYLMLLHWHFNLRLSRPPWELAILPWILQGFILILKTDPARLFVWFTVIHNLHTQNDSVLNSTIYYHELLVVSLIYLLLTRFELFSFIQSHM